MYSPITWVEFQAGPGKQRRFDGTGMMEGKFMEVQHSCGRWKIDDSSALFVEWCTELIAVKLQLFSGWLRIASGRFSLPPEKGRKTLPKDHLLPSCCLPGC